MKLQVRIIHIETHVLTRQSNVTYHTHMFMPYHSVSNTHKDVVMFQLI